MIRIIIADDHKLFVDGLVSLFEGADDIVIAGLANTGKEVIDIVKRELPDIVLMDIEMPEMDGIEATKNLAGHFPSVKVIALSMYKEGEFIERILKAGASGYVMKNAGKEELLRAIRRVSEGKQYLNEDASDLLIANMKRHENKVFENHVSLSKREIEIIQLLAEGLTAKNVAAKLNLSYYTIDTHRKNILLKLGVKNTAELIRYAFKHGIVR